MTVKEFGRGQVGQYGCSEVISGESGERQGQEIMARLCRVLRLIGLLEA